MAFLQSQNYPAEVLVVENGSADHTLAIAQSFSEAHPQVCVIRSPARGKGLAVQRGMLEAKGEYRFMCDADLSMPIQEVAQFLPPAVCDYDIAIASREAPGAVRYNEPYYRHFIGRGYNLLIRWLALPGLNDTQCGFKCFRGEVQTTCSDGRHFPAGRSMWKFYLSAGCAATGLSSFPFPGITMLKARSV